MSCEEERFDLYGKARAELMILLVRAEFEGRCQILLVEICKIEDMS